MNLILLYDRCKNKIVRSYRKYVFRKRIGCAHTDFRIIGDITLINTNIRLGRNVTIYPGCLFFGDGVIDIGDNVDVGQGTIIYSSKKGGVRIGNGTMVAAQCYLIDSDHGIQSHAPIRGQANVVKEIVIGSDAWIAANVTVLKGSKIGEGAVVGAKTLVNGEVPPYAIAVGVPFKVIKYRE